MERKGRLSGPTLMAWLLVFVAACTSSQYYAYTPAQPPPPTPSYSYILPSSAFLRGCASYGDDCAIVAQAFASDRVQFLNRNDWGWAEVRLERTGTVGWLPCDLLSPSPLSPVFLDFGSVFREGVEMG